MAIAAISGTYNMIHPDAAIRADGLARLATLIRAAPLMGVPLVTLCTGTRHPTDQWAHHPDNAGPAAWHDLIVEMVKAVSLAEACGVDLGIEPELANVVSSPKLARRLIDSIGSPRIRIVLDPANLFETASPDEIRAIVDRASRHARRAHRHGACQGSPRRRRFRCRRFRNHRLRAFRAQPARRGI